MKWKIVKNPKFKKSRQSEKQAFKTRKAQVQQKQKKHACRFVLGRHIATKMKTKKQNVKNIDLQASLDHGSDQFNKTVDM